MKLPEIYILFFIQVFITKDKPRLLGRRSSGMSANEYHNSKLKALS